MQNIILPAKPKLTASELQKYIGISPQLRLWKTNNQSFPAPTARKYSTAAVAAWLVARGQTVIFC